MLSSISQTVFLLCVALSAAPPEQASSSVVTWKAGDPSMDQEWVDGKLVRAIQANGLSVSVSFSEAPRAYVAAVAVINDSEQSVDVLPNLAELAIVSPGQKVLRAKDPARIIGSINNRAHLASTLDEIGASMQRDRVTSRSETQGTVSASGSGGYAHGAYTESTTTRATGPDWRARREAALRTSARMQGAGSDTDFVMRAALRANTVRPGGQLAGLMWFDKDSLLKKPDARVLVRLPVGSLVFEFPFGRSPR